MTEQNIPTQRRILVANNDNLLPILEEMLGKDVYAKIAELRKSKSLCENVDFSADTSRGPVEVQLLRGEEAVKEILQYSNPLACGVTGSDLALAAILDGKYGYFNSVTINGALSHIWNRYSENRVYADLAKLFPDGTLKEGAQLSFTSPDKVIEMGVLPNYKDIVPALSIIGGEHTNFGEIIARRKTQGAKVKVVCEARYEPLARNVLEAKRAALGFDYDIKQVSGSTEGYVLRHGQADMPWKCDVSVDVVRTGDTALKNHLAVYERVMQTAPVEIHCRTAGTTGRQTLKDMVA